MDFLPYKEVNIAPGYQKCPVFQLIPFYPIDSSETLMKKWPGQKSVKGLPQVSHNNFPFETMLIWILSCE